MLALSPACGLLRAEAWREHSRNAVGKVRVSISQHMSHLPVLHQQGQQREPGGRAAPAGPWEAGGTQGAVPPCLHPKLPGSVAGEPAAVRAWPCPLHRAGWNFAVGPNSLRRSPPTEILLQIWEQSVAVSFPSHGPDTRLAAAGGDPWVWGWEGGLSLSSLLSGGVLFWDSCSLPSLLCISRSLEPQLFLRNL